jgi:hypothetical protein
VSLTHLELRLRLISAAHKAGEARERYGAGSKEYRYARGVATRARNRLGRALAEDEQQSLLAPASSVRAATGRNA